MREVVLVDLTLIFSLNLFNKYLSTASIIVPTIGRSTEVDSDNHDKIIVKMKKIII